MPTSSAPSGGRPSEPRTPPIRFCRDKSTDLDSWDYIPFSGGPRICIGQQFALTQMSYLVARVFQEFRGVEARDELPMVQKLSTTISLLNGCWVSLKA